VPPVAIAEALIILAAHEPATIPALVNPIV